MVSEHASQAPCCCRPCPLPRLGLSWHCLCTWRDPAVCVPGDAKGGFGHPAVVTQGQAGSPTAGHGSETRGPRPFQSRGPWAAVYIGQGQGPDVNFRMLLPCLSTWRGKGRTDPTGHPRHPSCYLQREGSECGTCSPLLSFQGASTSSPTCPAYQLHLGSAMSLLPGDTRGLSRTPASTEQWSSSAKSRKPYLSQSPLSPRALAAPAHSLT